MIDLSLAWIIWISNTKKRSGFLLGKGEGGEKIINYQIGCENNDQFFSFKQLYFMSFRGSYFLFEVLNFKSFKVLFFVFFFNSFRGLNFDFWVLSVKYFTGFYFVTQSFAFYFFFVLLFYRFIFCLKEFCI